MKKKTTTILVIFLVAILTIIYTLASTYAVIIEVKDEDGKQEIINRITLRDLVTNDNGVYNNYYYDVKNELDITDVEATLLIESKALNDNLQVVLNSVVDYKLNDKKTKLTNDEIYNLINEGLNKTGNLSEELKTKVINKTNEYINDISDYLYDIDVKLIGV